MLNQKSTSPTSMGVSDRPDRIDRGILYFLIRRRVSWKCGMVLNGSLDLVGLSGSKYEARGRRAGVWEAWTSEPCLSPSQDQDHEP
jgi:hypothetical protein